MKRHRLVPSALDLLEDRVVPSPVALAERHGALAALVRSRHHGHAIHGQRLMIVRDPGLARGAGELALRPTTPPAGLVTPIGGSPTATGLPPSSATTNVALNGSLFAGLTSSQGYDQGANLRWSGSGQVGALGPVQFQGTITLSGQGASQVVKALLTLTNAQGSVTVSVANDPQQPGNALRYQIVGGSGAYQRATGSGNATLEEGGPLVNGGAANPPKYGFSLAMNFGDGPGAVVPL
jgi:hypothetical protein